MGSNEKKKSITRVLIANRGEIALRVIRACHEMGLEAVALYSSVDRRELHVRYANEAHLLTGETPLSCYLDGKQILEIALQHNCQAIHPGYGFLSENSEFASQVEQKGLIFIGPSSESMDLMGNKVKARQKVQEVGVPIIPGTTDPVSMASLSKEAKKIGFPVMLKAQGGGGGKGIRIVHQEEDLISAFERASSEAKTAFGDGSLYLEKAILKPRHVELQILGDGLGKAISLGERDCSLQRRHQKMIEESPCAFISPTTRKALHCAGILVAEAVNYRGAGTVEFLIDEQEKFYFLEMNTRLQVEHPVSELVYGIDLVRAQLQIAMGDIELPKNLVPKGHAIEIRILAEDPTSNFLPSIGKITFLHLPGGPGIRLDNALYEGQTITPYYDSLLAKLIVYGETREQARKRALGALQEFEIGGLSTNIPYVYSLLESEKVQKGEFYTRFLEEDFIAKVPEKHQNIAALASALYEHLKKKNQLISSSKSKKKDFQPWKFYGRVNQLRK